MKISKENRLFPNDKVYYSLVSKNKKTVHFNSAQFFYDYYIENINLLLVARIHFEAHLIQQTQYFISIITRI